MDLKQDHYDLFPTLHLETVDQLRADTLGAETEFKLKQRCYDLIEEIVAMDVVGTPEEMQLISMRTSFLKGKLEALKDLLEDSKGARLAHLAAVDA